MSQPFLRTTRGLRADGPQRAWWAWGLALAGLLAWAAWFLGAGIGVVAVSRSARLEVTQRPHPLAAPVAGTLRRTQLTLGRRVHAGEVLAELDDSTARALQAEADARVAAMAPRLAALQAALVAQSAAEAATRREALAALAIAEAREQEAAAGAAFAAEHERRLQAEAHAGGVPEVDALRAAAESRRLQAQLAAQVAERRRLALGAETLAAQGRQQAQALQRDLAALQAELAQARAARDSADTRLEQLRLRAPVDGVLADVQALAPGAWVAEGRALASVLPAGELTIVAEFDPASALGRVQPGQPATLALDGYPWVQYGRVQARVLRVAAEAHEQRLRVELQPEGPGRAPLQHGLPGRVEVAVERATPAQLLWRAAGVPW